MSANQALVIIDVQKDFCPGGALAVPRGDEVIPLINRLSGAGTFTKVIATQDWHPADHVSFARRHGREPLSTMSLDGVEQTLWPDHCVQGEPGAEFHPDLNLKPVDLILR